jgi:DNA repair and recombination protein RadB
LKNVVPTGCNSLDKLLKGGLPAEGVSLIYGEAETGKTAIAIQCAVNSARKGYKTIFVDTDGTFSSRRFSQIAHYDYEEIAPSIIIASPLTFREQALIIDNLEEYLSRKIGLIVFDTVTSLYRVELGTSEQNFALNRELNRQVAYLAQITKTHRTAILISSQVRSVRVKDQIVLEPVAERVLKFWSDVVIHFEKTGKTGVIKAIFERMPWRKSSTSCFFKIDKTGIIDYI